MNKKTSDFTADDLRPAVLKTIVLRKAGTYVAQNGNVVLFLTDNPDGSRHVFYSVGFTGWNFLFTPTELKIEPDAT